jgi:hypothetical protein
MKRTWWPGNRQNGETPDAAQGRTEELPGMTAQAQPGAEAPTIQLPQTEKPAIGLEEIRAARKTLDEYIAGKRETDSRIISNELWSRMAQEELEHSDHDGNRTDPALPSAYALNSLHNFHGVPGL